MRTKKIISCLMALLMVFSVLAISATAWTAETTEELKVTTVPNVTVVQPGDTISFDVILDKNMGLSTDNAFGNVAFSWMYNEDLIKPQSIVYNGVMSEFVITTRALGRIVVENALTQVYAASTPEETARWDANGYNAICKLQGIKDAQTTWGATGYWPIQTETDDGIIEGTANIATITCQISPDAVPGTEIHFDAISGISEKRHTAVQFADRSANNKMAYKYGAQYYNTADASMVFTVASATQGPAVAFERAQVKMTKTSATTVADPFSYRVISQISDADWTTYFANTGVEGATTNAITNVGFVAYKGTAGFDLDTAKSVAAGTATEGYSVATTTYVQKVAGQPARFGCRLDITGAETRSDVTYLAFVQYLDAEGAAQTIFYDAQRESLLNTSYDQIVAAYLAAQA